MASSKTLASLLLVLLVLIGGAWFTLVDSSQGEGVQSASPELVENKNISSFLPTLSVSECSNSDYNNCIYDSNSYGSADAYVMLLNEDLTYIRKTSEKYVVRENEDLNYKCVGDKAFFREETGTPSLTWSSSGVSSSYERIGLEGSIDFSDRGKIDGLQIICADHDSSSGDWTGIGIWSYFDRAIEVNEEPVVNSIDSPSEIVEGESNRFSVSADDPNGQSLDFDWSNGDTGSSAEYVFSEPGSQTVSVEVSDGYLSSEKSITVNVLEANKPPVINSVDHPSTVGAGESFTVSVNASDPNSDELSVEWSNGANGKSASYSFDSEGSKTLFVSVSDGEEVVREEFSVVVEKQSFWSKITGFFNGLW